MLANDTPLWQLSVGEFRTLCKEVLESQTKPAEISRFSPEDLCYGYKEIAKFLKVGESTMYRWKRDRLLDKALIQYGRRVIAIKEELLKVKENGKSK